MFCLTFVLACSSATHVHDGAVVDDADAAVRDGALDDAARDGGATDGALGDSAVEGADASTPRLVDPVASRAREDYADDEHGVVTASTLVRWLDDWETTRPRHVRGELVILQLDAAAEPSFVASRPGVRAYHAAELTRLSEPRNNGLVAIGAVPASGVRLDSFMRRFRITPNHDLVLLATGEPSATSLATLARAWLAFRYWGFEHASLAILHEPVSSALDAAHRTDEPAAHPLDGAIRVDALATDRFEILADVGAVRRAAERGAPILDVRPPEEHDGEHAGASPLDGSCLRGVPSCRPSRTGRIRGSISLPWRALLTDDARLRPRAELDALFGAADVLGPRDVTVYDTDGLGSALTVFALVALVGQPARWYAASFLEWGSLNASHPDPALRTLPPGSPWRTDVEDWTEGSARWTPSDEAIRPIVFDPGTASTDLVQTTDRRYRIELPPLPAVGAVPGGC